MVEALKAIVLRAMKVPPKPDPPAGSEGSVRVFRASRRLFHFNVLRWMVAQGSTLIGVVAALTALHAGGAGAEVLAGKFSYEHPIYFLITLTEIVGIVFFFVQLPFSFFLVLLDWEMRWYIVTDRSLRIREGVVRVKEMTMTFANIQEVSIRQGPIQRLLGISDLRVRTAGGGGSAKGPPAKQRQQEEHSPHIGFFHGVDNAPEIRDLILSRLKQARDAGLGDPDQARRGDAAVPAVAGRVLQAGRALLSEAQALRRTVAARQSSSGTSM